MHNMHTTAGTARLHAAGGEEAGRRPKPDPLQRAPIEFWDAGSAFGNSVIRSVHSVSSAAMMACLSASLMLPVNFISFAFP